MNQTITMRIWTKLGKEHIYYVSDFRVHNGEILIGSSELDNIKATIRAGQPCSLSFLTCESEDEVGRYIEHSYRVCTINSERIVFDALCVPA